MRLEDEELASGEATLDLTCIREHLRAMRDINARLHAVRLVEGNLISETDQELARLTAAADRGDVAALRTGWRNYHRRRQRLVAVIVRALLRD